MMPATHNPTSLSDANARQAEVIERLSARIATLEAALREWQTEIADEGHLAHGNTVCGGCKKLAELSELLDRAALSANPPNGEGAQS